jgi:hypothetical protein
VIVHGVRKMVEDDPRFKVVAEASTMTSFQEKVIAGGLEVALANQDKVVYLPCIHIFFINHSGRQD